MTENNKPIDINTGEPIRSKKKTALKAERWEHLYQYLLDGTASLTLAGSTLEISELGNLIEHLDEQIKKARTTKRKDKAKRWQSKNLK